MCLLWRITNNQHLSESSKKNFKALAFSPLEQRLQRKWRRGLQKRVGFVFSVKADPLYVTEQNTNIVKSTSPSIAWGRSEEKVMLLNMEAWYKLKDKIKKVLFCCKERGYRATASNFLKEENGPSSFSMDEIIFNSRPHWFLWGYSYKITKN